MSEQSLVSVRVASYNHEPYITQCIEGILMQKTNFPFEIIIGEDCGPDRTREIILSYRDRYPDLIKVVFPEQNTGGARLSFMIQQACQGKYHAMCEGDDYWIDPLKLQKQVDFMEAHPDVNLCIHNALILNEPRMATRIFYEHPLQPILSFDEAIQIRMPTASKMVRSEAIKSLPDLRFNIWCGDLLFELWALRTGKLGYIHEIMAVYRRHLDSMTVAMRSQQDKRHQDVMLVYRQIDKETGYQHTAALQARIKQAEEKYRRNRLGWRYFVRKPAAMIDHLQEYLRAVKRYRTMYR